jgi:antitoxin YefM
MNWSVNWSVYKPIRRKDVIHFSETVPASQAKTHFSSLMKRIREQHESFAISQRGKIEGVLLGINEYESLVETLEILSDREMMASLDRGLREEKEERLYSHEDVFKD